MSADTTVTVVIPCLDAEPWLAAQLEALVAQEFDGSFEIIVADNGSTDGSAGVAASFDGVTVVEVPGGPSPNRARNAGAAVGSGDLILFTDADDVVAPGWIAAMVSALAQTDLVTGVLDITALNSPSVRRFRHRRPGARFGFLPAVHGGNFGIRRSTFEALGGWDADLPYGPDDIELAWRAQLRGFTISRAVSAVVLYRMRPLGEAQRDQAFRQGFNLPRLHAQFSRDGFGYKGFLVRGLQFAGFMAVTLPLVPFIRSVRAEWVRRFHVARGFATGMRQARR